MLNNLGQYLRRFKNQKPREEQVREVCRSVIGEVVGFECSNDMFRVSGSIVWLGAPGVVKQEVARNQEEILRQVNLKLGGNPVTEIK